MNSAESTSDVAIDVENVGGIDGKSLSFSSGVTVLTGENATNRTSFLQSLMGALGSDEVSLKSDADQGQMTLELDGEQYKRTLERADGRTETGGTPYLDDAGVADLFAFLLEANEARQAVRQGRNLRELILRPVDTDEIRAEIDSLETEKRRIDEKIEELTQLEDELSTLRTKRSELQSNIEAQQATVEEKRDTLESLDGSLEESRDNRDQLEAELAELEETRTKLEETRTQLSTEEASIESLQSERADIESSLSELTDDVSGRLSEIDSELDRLRAHKRSLDSTINRLGQVVQFNESVLDGESETILESRATSEESDSVTDQLLADDDIVCWTCGSAVEQSAIEDTLDDLRNLRQERVSERRTVQDDIDALQTERRELDDTRTERTRLQRRLDDVTEEIETREETASRLRSQRETLESQVGELEERVKTQQSTEHREILEAHRAVNEAEFELDSLREEKSDVEDRIEQLETDLGGREELRAERDSIKTQLTDLRTRIERLEASVVDIFNEEMETVLSLLGYDNIERIWIERRERETREGRRKTTDRVFELHVVRGSTDGRAYEDSVENLSESEREVAGLVFALAGYLAHDVYETVPFMVLDSLEAIDSARIATLVDYFSEYAPHLVVALLDADAAAVDSSYERIEMGD